eukprot:TRINITY_DN8867_c0_g1_i2.p1 TRINITY_DN8867_c0_g1~~TRINITY_DN8867_c0_g1_i2.p1  ORF type:complete len:552 (+),score=83.01 TRINITY_DN8867_c0_g1_i2:171-1826(+)
MPRGRGVFKSSLVAAWLFGTLALGRLMHEFIPTRTGASSKQGTMQSAKSSIPLSSFRMKSSGAVGVADAANKATLFTRDAIAGVMASAVGCSVAIALLGSVLSMTGLQVRSGLGSEQQITLHEQARPLSIELRERARAILQRGHHLQRDQIVQGLSNATNVVGAAIWPAAIALVSGGMSKGNSNATRPHGSEQGHLPPADALLTQDVVGESRLSGAEDRTQPSVTKVDSAPLAEHDKKSVDLPPQHAFGTMEDLHARASLLEQRLAHVEQRLSSHQYAQLHAAESRHAITGAAASAAAGKTSGITLASTAAGVASGAAATVVGGAAGPATAEHVSVHDRSLPSQLASHLRRLGLSVDAEGRFRYFVPEAAVGATNVSGTLLAKDDADCLTHGMPGAKDAAASPAVHSRLTENSAVCARAQVPESKFVAMANSRLSLPLSPAAGNQLIKDGAVYTPRDDAVVVRSQMPASPRFINNGVVYVRSQGPASTASDSRRSDHGAVRMISQVPESASVPVASTLRSFVKPHPSPVLSEGKAADYMSPRPIYKFRPSV